MKNPEFVKAAEKYLAWIKDDALPLWGSVGIDPDSGSSVERLLENGEADRNTNIRVRVQARQIFVFSVAQQFGWYPQAEPHVNHITKFVNKYARHPSGVGYIHTLTPEYAIGDQRLDLYDHAFFLLANAWRYRVFDMEEALHDAHDIVTMLDTRLGKCGGGWKEGDYEYQYRRQNPHMHLFEAFMSLFEATQDSSWLNRAGEIYSLFETYFFDGARGVLLEYFEEDLSRLSGSQGEIVEPGHMLEWVWLLRWYQRLTDRDISSHANILYDNALKFGLSASGLLYDQVTADGHILSASKRCWPMTELIKASLVQASAGHDDCERQATLAIERLLDHFTSVPTKGAYVDRLDEDDCVIDATSPASSMYHLIAAASEINTYLSTN